MSPLHQDAGTVSLHRTLGLWSAGLIGLILAVVVIGWLVSAPGRARRETVAARTETALSRSRTESAQAAGVTLDQAHDQQTASETLSRETADVLQVAPGADVRLNSDLNRVGRERLCRRAAYRGRPECLQYAPGAQPTS
jgi:hypothetical protein